MTTIRFLWNGIILLLGSLLLLSPASAQEDACATRTDVRTLAGPPPGANPRSGYLDGPTALALFNYPTYIIPYGGTAARPLAWLLVSDSGNHAVRMVINGSEVRTLAGTGLPGYLDGPGTVAQFNQPAGLAVDDAGNVYVADQGNHVIRRIGTDGQVVTIAGQGGIAGLKDGWGGKALFHFPQGLTYKPDANGGSPMLLVTEAGNHCVRRVGLENGFPVSTLAGVCGQAGAADGAAIGQAQFSRPRSIDWGGEFSEYEDASGLRRRFRDAGFIVIIDDAGVRLLRYNPDQSLTVTTLPAGRGAASVFADFFNNLYIAKPNSSTIEGIRYRGLVDWDDQSMLLAGGGQKGYQNSRCGERALFNLPFGVSAYFYSVVAADTYNHALRIIGVPSGRDGGGTMARCSNCGPPPW